MSVNPEVSDIVALPVHEEAATAANGHNLATLTEAPPAPVAEAVPAPAAAAPATAKRSRPGWILPTAIAAVGLIASGTLGYFFYTTLQQRDALHQQLVSTKATLATTQSDLTDAKTLAASRKVTADYVAMYVNDDGKVQTDYNGAVACNTYSSCRTVAQQLLTDMQQFQSDRKSATVPAALASTDSSLGDALSAGIAGDQEFIAGMDNNDDAKIKEGFNKVVAAMLNVGKAQAELGAEIK
jgi:hypothetical protein